MRTLLFVSITILAACAHLPPQYKNPPKNTKLDPAAYNVNIVEFLPSVEKDKYDEVEMLSCALGMNMKPVETNMNSCYNFFKNEAYSRGSKLILVKPENKRIGTEMISGGSGPIHCENCVDMKAIILMPKKK